MFYACVSITACFIYCEVFFFFFATLCENAYKGCLTHKHIKKLHALNRINNVSTQLTRSYGLIRIIKVLAYQYEFIDACQSRCLQICSLFKDSFSIKCDAQPWIKSWIFL